MAKKGSRVQAHWIGTLADGKKWKNTREKGGVEEFTVGLGMVLPGFDVGVMGMRKGDVWKMTIPPELAFGKHGGPYVPANSTVVLEVEILDVQ